MHIEAYPEGYPRFSALIAAHGPFSICRRFCNIRARLLLLKQDRLSVLEKQLEEIDLAEKMPLARASVRWDNNPERRDTLSQIDSALADYDAFVERSERMFRLNSAQSRDISSLRNWLNGNACLARNETAYLECDDLFTLASTNDNALACAEAWAEDSLIKFVKNARKYFSNNTSKDPHVYIARGLMITRVARALLAALIVVLLLAPALICNFISHSARRIIVIIIAIICFIAVLSGLTQAKTLELFIAGSTYAAVLTVFISGSNGGEKI